MISVKHLQQPTPVTCAHTCLAMVTGEPIEGLIERFGDRGLGFPEKACVLVEHGIFPVKTRGQVCEFPYAGVYLVSTPSLNLPGQLHLVVVVVDEDGYTIYDPNLGREGVDAYSPGDMMTRGMARCDVIYLDTRILSEMKRGAGVDVGGPANGH